MEYIQAHNLYFFLFHDLQYLNSYKIFKSRDALSPYKRNGRMLFWAVGVFPPRYGPKLKAHIPGREISHKCHGPKEFLLVQQYGEGIQTKKIRGRKKSVDLH